MRVLFVKGNFSGLGTGNIVRMLLEQNQGFEIDWADRFTNAIDSLEDDPGEEAYDAVILGSFFGSDAGNTGLPEEALALSRKTCPEWAFYTHVLSKYPRLQERTVFWNSSVWRYREKIGDDIFSKLTVLKALEAPELRRLFRSDPPRY